MVDHTGPPCAVNQWLCWSMALVHQSPLILSVPSWKAACNKQKSRNRCYGNLPIVLLTCRKQRITHFSGFEFSFTFYDFWICLKAIKEWHGKRSRRMWVSSTIPTVPGRILSQSFQNMPCPPPTVSWFYNREHVKSFLDNEIIPQFSSYQYHNHSIFWITMVPSYWFL